MLAPSSPLPAKIHLDIENQCLWRNEERVELTPKRFGVLRHLVEHREALVTKQELLKAVWRHAHVEQGQVKQFVADLRKILDDDPDAPSFIETVHGRGYRFIGQITLLSERAEPAAKVQRPATGAPSWLHLAAEVSLIGRDKELALLHRQMERALAGEHSLCVVTGEPGIGKSTLVAAFVQRLLAKHNVWILRGQCVEPLQSADPLLPVLSALEELCDGPESEQIIECMRRYAPLWLQQIPGRIRPAELEELQHRCQGASQARMLREFSRLLEVLGTERLVLLWLEDLHWADESTLNLIVHLAHQQRAGRLMTICTSRPIEAHSHRHSLRTLASLLRSRNDRVELILPPLSESCVKEYLDTRWPEEGTRSNSPYDAAAHERLAALIYR